MATLLYRLGRGAFRRRRLAVSLWLGALAALLAVSGALGSALDDEFTIPGSESQRALDTLREVLPAAGGTTGQLVFTTPDGSPITDERWAEPLARSLANAAEAPEVSAVVPPEEAGTISADGRTALATVRYPETAFQLADGTTEALQRTVEPARAAGLDVHVGGQAFSPTGVEISAKELFGVVVALLVLVITFGSMLAAGMPLLTALVGVGTAVAALLVGGHLFTLSSTAITLAVMLGLAVGIDYALFILSRHRSHLARGMDPEESAGRALGTAGSAVVFAGLTVVVALCGLSVVGIPFLTVMGLAGAATVTVAVLVAVTLLPALLGFAGERLRPAPGSRAARREEHDAASAAPAATLGDRWVRLVTGRPLLTVLAVVVGLLVIAIPARELRLALPDNGSAPHGSTERETYDAISDAFGPGLNGPLLILADTADVEGDPAPALADVTDRLGALPGMAQVAPARPTERDTAWLIEAVPASGPDQEGTERLVHTIRDFSRENAPTTGVTLAVTGNTAVAVDVSRQLSDSMVPFGAVVVGLGLLILLLVFRSLVVPLKATLGFLLSVAAAFGAVVMVFEWGWLAGALDVARTGPVVSFLPIILMGVLFGLAMDYEVFVVSRIHERHAHGAAPADAVREGAPLAFRVVTAAALIMFAVFASFVTMEDAIVKPIALALAVGVAVDAFLIRLTLVPAVLVLVGRAGWWLPGWLDRLLPHVDVEGSRLPKPRADAVPAPAERPHTRV
ncbi:MMPL family transporter [Streptomyces sp. 3MP-14]|uniref:MMPL family transporter n=1 Tax=Streptomyces mimosae TaxID=2586635 RepID=A0A5N6A1S7_9ACTN|nr:MULTISPECIES: MMPL family transporter [Streptomyces]KAB8161949.1 MMPL family transporter [Streptomyces mimosae]KAB8173647.1 MMPL family transporter [Streptomyces sp. 3MP-14]